MRFPENDQVLLSWLRLAPAAEVAEFLSCEREPKSFWDWDDPLPSGALTEILARDDSFLNLVVATYGFDGDRDALPKLWRKADPQFRQAILANRNRGLYFCSSDDLAVFLASAPEDELLLALTVAFCGPEQLDMIFLRRPPFDKMSDDQWTLARAVALQNPNFRIEPPQEVGYFPSTSHLRPPVAEAWDLLRTAPTTLHFAELLCAGFSAFYCGYAPRWRSWNGDNDENSEDSIETFASESEAEDFLAVMARWHGEPGSLHIYHKRLRILAASHITSDSTALRSAAEASDDPAIRVGYYKNKQFRSAEEVDAAVDAAGFLFFKECSENETLHSRYRPGVPRRLRARFLELRSSDLDERENWEWAWSDWKAAGDRLHSKAPDRFFAWGEQAADRTVFPADEGTASPEGSDRDQNSREKLFQIITIALLILILVIEVF